MSKKTKKKKDIPAITWVDHNDFDDWIDNNLQNMFRPTSSSSQKKSPDELRRDMQKIFDPSSSSYIEKRTEDNVSVISNSMTSKDLEQKRFHLAEETLKLKKQEYDVEQRHFFERDCQMKSAQIAHNEKEVSLAERTALIDENRKAADHQRKKENQRM